MPRPAQASSKRGLGCGPSKVKSCACCPDNKATSRRPARSRPPQKSPGSGCGRDAGDQKSRRGRGKKTRECLTGFCLASSLTVCTYSTQPGNARDSRQLMFEYRADASTRASRMMLNLRRASAAKILDHSRSDRVLRMLLEGEEPRPSLVGGGMLCAVYSLTRKAGGENGVKPEPEGDYFQR